MPPTVLAVVAVLAIGGFVAAVLLLTYLALSRGWRTVLAVATVLTATAGVITAAIPFVTNIA